MLNQQEIEKLIKEKSLITDYINLDVQLTPNGFDLTVGAVFEFESCGALDFSNKERKIPSGKEIIPKKQKPQDKFGWWNLKKGAYKIKTNETINLSRDLIGIAYPRTSLLRMGAFIANGIWDAGFQGKSEFILVVENPNGIKLKQNARVNHLVFFRINQTSQGYQGIYKNL